MDPPPLVVDGALVSYATLKKKGVLCCPESRLLIFTAMGAYPNMDPNVFSAVYRVQAVLNRTRDRAQPFNGQVVTREARSLRCQFLQVVPCCCY